MEPNKPNTSHFDLDLASQPELNTPGALERFVQNLLSGAGLLLGVVFIGLAALLHSYVVPAIVLADLGSVLLGLSLFHLAHERLLRRHEQAFVAEMMRSIVSQLHSGYGSLRGLGIEKAYADLPALMEDIKQSMLHAKLVRLLKTWSPGDISLEQALRSTQATVHLFLCNLNAQVLYTRSQGANEMPGAARLRNIEAVQRMQAWLLDGAPHSGSVTFYDTWPGTPLIQCDERLYVGFYVRGASSMHTPWLKVRANSPFGRRLLRQFHFAAEHVTERLETPQDLAAWLQRNGANIQAKSSERGERPELSLAGLE